MQDFICVNSFKRSKRSVSEQKVIEVDNITMVQKFIDDEKLNNEIL